METPLATLELPTTPLDPAAEEPGSLEEPDTPELPATELPALAPLEPMTLDPMTLEPMTLDPTVLDAITLEDPARDDEPGALEPPTLDAPMLEPPPPLEDEDELSPVPLFPVHAAPNPATTTATRPVLTRIMPAPMFQKVDWSRHPLPWPRTVPPAPDHPQVGAPAPAASRGQPTHMGHASCVHPRPWGT